MPALDAIVKRFTSSLASHAASVASSPATTATAAPASFQSPTRTGLDLAITGKKAPIRAGQGAREEVKEEKEI